MTVTIGTPGHVLDAGEARSFVRAQVADLNLADPADVTRLDARIHEAAVAVCGPTEYPLGFNLSQFQEARHDTEICIRRTEQRARARLAALHPHAPAVQMAAAGH